MLSKPRTLCSRPLKSSRTSMPLLLTLLLSNEKMMDETNEDIAVKETELNHKSNQKDQAEANIASLKKNLAMTQDELDKALDYYEKLKADCIDTGLSYEERKKMR